MEKKRFNRVMLMAIASLMMTVSLSVNAKANPAAFQSQSLPPVTLAGTTDAKIMTVLIDRNRVKALLPPQLELAQDAATPAGLQAVSIFLQVTSDLRLVNVPGPKFAPYQELVFIVHNVRFKNGTKVYSYFDRLYLDSLLPIVLGYYLGYPKHFGKFEFGETEFKSMNERGEPLASMTFTSRQGDSPEFQANYAAFKESLSKPVIANGYGKILCSQFHFDFANAHANPIDARWAVTENLRPAVAGNYDVPGLDISQVGGLSIQASWTLDGPLPCEAN